MAGKKGRKMAGLGWPGYIIKGGLQGRFGVLKGHAVHDFPKVQIMWILVFNGFHQV
jgi:hypothetical protein